MVSSHNFNSQNVKFRVSNPMFQIHSKSIVNQHLSKEVYAYNNSKHQALEDMLKHELVKTDRSISMLKHKSAIIFTSSFVFRRWSKSPPSSSQALLSFSVGTKVRDHLCKLSWLFISMLNSESSIIFAGSSSCVPSLRRDTHPAIQGLRPSEHHAGQFHPDQKDSSESKQLWIVYVMDATIINTCCLI